MKHQVVEAAQKYLGTPFRRHSHPHIEETPKTGFSCSGYWRYVLKEAGYQLPPEIIHVRDVYDHFGVHVSKENAEIGDSAFWSRSGVMPEHLTIIIGENLFIHCSTLGGKVCISTLDEMYTKFPQTITYEPVRWPKLYQTNPIGYKTY